MKAEIVAEYILHKAKIEDDLISNMKLQKLLYYMQGFHLAIIDTPLFDEDIVNWMHGPVVEEIYEKYKLYGRDAIPFPKEFDVSQIDSESKELMDDVYDVYGQYSASALRNSSHSESPWKSTNNFDIISHKLLKDYFKTRIVDDGEEGKRRE